MAKKKSTPRKPRKRGPREERLIIAPENVNAALDRFLRKPPAKS